MNVWSDGLPFTNNISIMSDDAIMYHGEYVPSHAEFRAVGAVGIILFSSILCVAIFRCFQSIRSHRSGSENRIRPMFHFSIAFLALLDLPRYYAIAINATYTSVQGYACHILSGVCYFVALALVGYSFANLLELGHYASLLYSKRGLIAAVVLHAAIDLTGFIQCLRTPRLADFFTSQYYQVMYPSLSLPYSLLMSFLHHTLFHVSSYPQSLHQSLTPHSYHSSFLTHHSSLLIPHTSLPIPRSSLSLLVPHSSLLMTGIHCLGHCPEPIVLGGVDVLRSDGHRTVRQPREGHV